MFWYMSELMTAVVLAEGRRKPCAPLTCDVPKPMVRLCGRPLMAYTLDLLERHGVRRARICTRYLPTRVEEGLGEQHRGVALSYQESDRDCGPAGNARQALLALADGEETVLVIRGDILTDIDLTSALAFHKAAGGGRHPGRDPCRRSPGARPRGRGGRTAG